jgi:glycosyltransferase involved in cell wall biosynthesis
MAPQISCISTFLNAGRFLDEAIQSVLAQDHADWELLLVDDGSTDQSSTIAQHYAEQYPTKIRYLCHPNQANRGVSASRNLGIAHSRGAYLAFLDADDVWLPHKLSRQVALLQSNPEAAMVYGHVQLWHSWQPSAPKPDSFVSLGVTPDKVIGPPRLLENLLRFRYQTPVPSNTMIRREVIDRHGGFEEELRIYEDQAFFSKILFNEPVFVSSEYWARYRQHEDSACAWMDDVAAVASAYCSTKLAFLDWLAAYLSARSVRNPLIWLPLSKERWFCQRPQLTRTCHVLGHQYWNARSSISHFVRTRNAAR